MYVDVSQELLISFQSTTFQSGKQSFLQTSVSKSNSPKKEESISSKKYTLILEIRSNFILNHKLIQQWKANLKR